MIGSQVCPANRWDIGSQFQLVHGGAESTHKHEEKFTVCGVLAPTGTPNDKTVYIHLDGFYSISGHDNPIREAVKRWHEFDGKGASRCGSRRRHRGVAEEVRHHRAERRGKPSTRPAHHHHHHHAACEVQKEVTAILVNMKSRRGRRDLLRRDHADTRSRRSTRSSP